MDARSAAARWADTWVPVEYRALLYDRDGAPVTLAGSAFARFDADGLIVEARDYWHQTAGHIPPG
jgi:hypothetical protein